MFIGHVEITDKSASTGFEQYLLIETDYGDRCEAYGIDEDTIMDLEALLNEVYSSEGFSVSMCRSACGSNYAAIITDGRTPDSVVVWESTDFYLDSKVKT